MYNLYNSLSKLGLRSGHRTPKHDCVRPDYSFPNVSLACSEVAILESSRQSVTRWLEAANTVKGIYLVCTSERAENSITQKLLSTEGASSYTACPSALNLSPCGLYSLLRSGPEPPLSFLCDSSLGTESSIKAREVNKRPQKAPSTPSLSSPHSYQAAGVC